MPTTAPIDPNAHPKILLTRKQAAAALSVGERTLWTLTWPRSNTFRADRPERPIRGRCSPGLGRVPARGAQPMSKSGVEKPARLDVIVENIPERVRKLRRWVVWRWHRRKGKWDKPPLQTNGEFASVDDPKTWCSFDDAKAAFQSGQFDGIGFVLGYVVDEDVTYVGVDLDNCRDSQTGEIQDWGAAHLAVLNTYAEVSPSGEGVKALALGTLPGPDRNDSARLGVEMYRGNRYFTVTGHRLTNTPAEIHGARLNWRNCTTNSSAKPRRGLVRAAVPVGPTTGNWLSRPSPA